MGFGAYITTGDDLAPLAPDLKQWLVEIRVEMELSKPTKFALRFEDDICNGSFAVQGDKSIGENKRIGIFVQNAEQELDCLVLGPVTQVKTENSLGGPGSWVEIHGEDRRVEMSRIGVLANYTGLASAAVDSIVQLYQFKPNVQDTLIDYDGKKLQLSQRGSDLAFIEEIARKNNMDFWLSYEVKKSFTGKLEVKETANLRTSPEREQGAKAVPQIPVLSAPPERKFAVNPPRQQCPGVNKFETRIDFEKPVAAQGFTFDAAGDKKIVEQIVQEAKPVDPKRPPQIKNGPERKPIPPAKVTPEEAFLAQEAIVFEQSWFVEVDASTTLDQAGFVVRPHDIVEFTYLDARLTGSYQVMKALHVITAANHFSDFTARANGLGG